MEGQATAVGTAGAPALTFDAVHAWLQELEERLQGRLKRIGAPEASPEVFAGTRSGLAELERRLTHIGGVLDQIEALRAALNTNAVAQVQAVLGAPGAVPAAASDAAVVPASAGTNGTARYRNLSKNARAEIMDRLRGAADGGAQLTAVYEQLRAEFGSKSHASLAGYLARVRKERQTNGGAPRAAVSRAVPKHAPARQQVAPETKDALKLAVLRAEAAGNRWSDEAQAIASPMGLTEAAVAHLMRRAHGKHALGDVVGMLTRTPKRNRVVLASELVTIHRALRTSSFPRTAKQLLARVAR